MTKQEMKDRINELRAAAETLSGPEKTQALTDIAGLKIDFRAQALAELRANLDAISLPDQNQIDQQIQRAKDATAAQGMRVAAINQGISIIRTVLGLAL